MQSATSEQNSSETDSERERNPTLCHYVNKWNVNQNVSLVPRVKKAKSSQSFDYYTSLLFYFTIFCDLIVHFVKFFKSFNVLSMIPHFISWLKNNGWWYKGPGRVRFWGEVDVLFDSRISCTWHVVVSPYFRHLYLVSDGFRLFASGCRCFWGGCRWL